MSNQTKPYATDLYDDFLKGQCERKAARYLAQKRYERKQRYVNAFLFCSIAFIVTVTLTTGMILWAEALA